MSAGLHIVVHNMRHPVNLLNEATTGMKALMEYIESSCDEVERKY